MPRFRLALAVVACRGRDRLQCPRANGRAADPHHLSVCGGRLRRRHRPPDRRADPCRAEPAGDRGEPHRRRRPHRRAGGEGRGARRQHAAAHADRADVGLPARLPKPGLRPDRRFPPVTQIATFDLAVAVGPSVPANSPRELAEWIKANPAQANYGIPAAGSLPHFFGVLFGRAAGLDLKAITYRGSAAALADVVGGQVPIMFTTTTDLAAAAQGRAHQACWRRRARGARRSCPTCRPSRRRATPSRRRLVRPVRAGKDADEIIARLQQDDRVGDRDRGRQRPAAGLRARSRPAPPPRNSPPSRRRTPPAGRRP